MKSLPEVTHSVTCQLAFGEHLLQTSPGRELHPGATFTELPIQWERPGAHSLLRRATLGFL